MIRTWMDSKIGPKIDHSCGTMPLTPTSKAGHSIVMSVGGWNNDVYSETETFDPEDNYWTVVSLDNSTKSLPFNIRSSALIELNRKPYLLGGVTCVKAKSGRKKCEKLASGLSFEAVDMFGISKVHGEWRPTPEVLKLPRSSHTIIHAPVTYFPGC
jgi:hypothetical protein